MKVGLFLEGQNTVPNAAADPGSVVRKFAGAFVLHGLSSGQAMERVREINTADIASVELTGTLAELNASFNKFGIVVRPAVEKEKVA